MSSPRNPRNKRNRKGPATMGDMYSLDNHEHLLLMSNPSSDDEESDITFRIPIESEMNWSQSADNDPDTCRNTQTSGFETSYSESEISHRDTNLLIPDTEQPFKQSSARTFRAFDYDSQAGGYVRF